MAIAGLGKALNVAAQGATAYQQRRDDRYKIQHQAAEDVLATKRAQAQSEPGNVEAEVQALRVQNDNLVNTAAKTASYDAFRSYSADGDPRHINRVFKEHPRLRELAGNVLSVEKIDLANDQRLLQKEGMDLTLFQKPDFDPEAFSHRFLKATLPDGTKRVVDMQKAMIGSGYANYATNEELDLMLKRAKLFGKDKEGTPSALEKKTQYLTSLGLGTEQEIAGSLYQAETAGVTPGKLQIAGQAEQKLQETFGDKYFDTDFTDRKNRIKASPYIRVIEQAGGEELAAADRADLKEINALISSGLTVAEELTPEATGALDNLTNNIRKYIEDEAVDATEGRAAYSAYRNALLRAFGGTAMSPDEVANFNAAFGTLAQKYPAVISQFKQAITQTKAKLETVARLNNPYLAQYYVGSSLDDVDIILTRLDENLNEIRKYQKVSPAKGEENKDWRGLWESKQ